MRTFVKIIVAGLVFWGKVMLISAQQVNYCEYYIDNDPGLGQGTAFSFSADTLIEISSQINVSAFSVGHHRLVLRCRDDSGRWSQHQTRVFNIYFPESSVNQLVEAEYWTGADPGQGNGSYPSAKSYASARYSAVVYSFSWQQWYMESTLYPCIFSYYT